MVLGWCMAGAAVLVLACGCAGPQAKIGVDNVGSAADYDVQQLHEPMRLDADWNKPQWRRVPAIELTHWMGERPEHFPRTQAKVLYDDRAIYVIFRVDDRYVRAVADKNQNGVCGDSCVEFFFVPGTDLAAGYFNLEMNAGGTMLFMHQLAPRRGSGPISDADLQTVQVAHSLPRTVDPEIQRPTVWTVEYRIPAELLTRYDARARRPAPGVTWRVNFYKCGDETSHPHWLTWSPVNFPRPDFHRPDSFGTIRFQ